MDAHRIHVLDGADDDGVVGAVAHDFHLEFLPSQHRFLDQHFIGGRCVEARFDNSEKFFLVIGNAAACTAEREGRANDGGQTDHRERVFGCAMGFFREAHDRVVAAVVEKISLFVFSVPQLAFQRHAAWHFESDFEHRAAEQFAVFRLVDRIRAGADQFDTIFFQRAALAQAQRGVERGLSAHGRQKRENPPLRHIRFLARDDFFDEVGCDGFDIGGIGQSRIGHDRGRIGIDEDDAITLRPERLAGLCPGIIELAGLADNNGPRSDDQNGMNVVAFGHFLSRTGLRTQVRTRSVHDEG